MRVIYRKIRYARYLYIKRNVEKVWRARYTLGARYLSKNTVNWEPDVCQVRFLPSVHDHPLYLCCPDVLSPVGDPLSGNWCGSPNHI